MIPLAPNYFDGHDTLIEAYCEATKLIFCIKHEFVDMPPTCSAWAPATYNLMVVHRYKGKVVHIDFGDCFEGNFRITCQAGLVLLREHKWRSPTTQS